MIRRLVGLKLMSGLQGPSASEGDAVVALAKAASGGNTVGKVIFGTEAGLFQRAGIPTLVCGPGFIEQAHKPNEFIAIAQVRACEAFLRRLMDQVCAR